MTAYHLAGLFDVQGPVSNSLTACAASAQAVGEATELIRAGHADAMLAGGSNSMIHPFGLSGFTLLTALSTRNAMPATASRPFDRDRDGFVLGEGAGAVILESLEHARAGGPASMASFAAMAARPTRIALPTFIPKAEAPPRA